MEYRGAYIKERNFRCRMGEIDLIIRDGRYLAFVEVKYRRTEECGWAAEAVDARKQRVISRVAQFYLHRYGYPEDTPCRFDVVAIDGERIQWIKNAFDYCG